MKRHRCPSCGKTFPVAICGKHGPFAKPRPTGDGLLETAPGVYIPTRRTLIRATKMAKKLRAQKAKRRALRRR